MDLHTLLNRQFVLAAFSCPVCECHEGLRRGNLLLQPLLAMHFASSIHVSHSWETGHSTIDESSVIRCNPNERLALRRFVALRHTMNMINTVHGCRCQHRHDQHSTRLPMPHPQNSIHKSKISFKMRLSSRVRDWDNKSAKRSQNGCSR
jgi:hypothetical protein